MWLRKTWSLLGRKLHYSLMSVNTHLYNFSRKPLTLDGSVELPIMINEGYITRTIMINFLVID